MAVIVRCYQCSQVLELDEGFRGGVCRCSHCGVMLQVPKAPTAAARQRPGAPPAGAAGARPSSPLTDPGLSSSGALRPRSGDSMAGGTGSGAASPLGSRPSSPRALPNVTPLAPAASTAAAPAITLADNASIPSGPAGEERLAARRISRRVYAVIFIGMVLLAAAAWVLISPMLQVMDTHLTPAGKSRAASTGAGSQKAGAASFFGIPIRGRRVLLSVDAAGIAGKDLERSAQELVQCLGAFDADQKVRIVVWREEKLLDVGDGNWVEAAAAARLAGALGKIQPAAGVDDIAAVRASLALAADQVVIISAREKFQENLAQRALDVRTADQRIDAVHFDGDGTEIIGPLEELAKSTGGQLRKVPAGGK